jgi:two-component system chemotaxis response regulator CheB
MSPIRVLVVDDSAFARKVIREVLARDAGITVVGVARDGAEALEKIAELRPEVVTLDLLMPDLDGLGVLRLLASMPKAGAPRVLVVSTTGSNTELAIEALQQGAVDLVTKPTSLATDQLYELAGELVAKVKAAASATPRLGHGMPIEGAVPATRALPPSRAVKLVVIGTSTGGPQALTRLFAQLPAGLPVPLAIALHIPAGYTASLAARLSQLGGIPVEEARDGQVLRPGQALIAPGGRHLRVSRKSGQLIARVAHEPRDSLFHPSVDLLFSSAAEQVGAAALGLILTGMGDDGREGSRAIRRAGGAVLAESASSCVVYGMPRSVIEDGLATQEAPLERIPQLLLERLADGAPPGRGK